MACLLVVGRHLFLQEKLERLAPPSTLAASAAAPQGMGMGAAASVLPPRLTPAAVETFLQCDQFAEVGCRWLVHKVCMARSYGKLTCVSLVLSKVHAPSPCTLGRQSTAATISATFGNL